ncbi:hypothetical protein AM493_11680 [Flavobacterium akiainvivens]|uniref:Lipocalin-like domain-containing protein n=1 Tax=Flavobacterium akiainvivens TaxID=1202724 RepID=A0A0M8MJ41_9FLAO|nr:hypothetical protein [Flavobacterium akiainvivens]KOS06618.1 hypothetical protein AM493_11680 [Flavobacterium akiainvivens]SFQ08985.1 hypothetical protein SAMN05444144_10123 [Flavobacterium akiainvivens]
MKKLLLILLFPIMCAAQEVYHIKFADQESIYSVAVLAWEDNTAMVRVRYIDRDCSGELIEMKATIADTTTGFTISCSDPMYAGTTKKAKNYNPDNFILTFKDEDGWICVNRDSANTLTPCSFMEVTGLSNQDLFLQEFDWMFEKK